MAILPFLIGLLPLLIGEELVDRLPRDPVAWRLVVSLPILAMPALLARLRGSILVREAFHGRLTRVFAEIIQMTSSGLAFAFWLFVGDGLDFLIELDEQGPTVRGTATVLPLLIAELARQTALIETVRRCQKADLEAPSGPPLLARRLTLLFGVVLIALHILVEALEGQPAVLALIDSTVVGNTVALGAGVLIVLAALPRVAVMILPTRRLRRSDLRHRLDRTLHGFGVDLKRVHLIDSGTRLFNAALVGVFPWSTRLLVTDGFVEILRPEALRGVLAHEVGHDRARHVAWLLLIGGYVPVLWLGPASHLLYDANVAVLGATGFVCILGLGLLCKLMHRFEHEADLESAKLMGSSEGVLEALSTVIKLHGGEDHASFRHPSVASRTGVLLRWESDPDYRRRFARRGRQIRAGLLVLALLATAGSIAAHAAQWKNDRLAYALAAGDFDLATELLESEPDPDQELVTFCRTADRVSPGPFRSFEDQTRLAGAAESEAETALRDGDLEMARTWLEIAASYGRSSQRKVATLALLDAIEAEDPSRQRVVARHLAGLRSAGPVWTEFARVTLERLSSD